MQPISGAIPGAAQSPISAAGVKEPSKVLRPEDEAQGRPLKPVTDEYVPEEKQEPSGRYWLSRDEDGRPKIYFDDPKRAADAPKQPEDAPDAKKLHADAPEAEEAEEPDQAGQGAKGSERKKDEVWKSNTDKVDREIKKLKKKRQELEQRLNTETDEAKIKDLERQLSQAEQELRQKDNDAYRRQHAQVTRIS